jgi:hypothetical protein
MAIKNTVLLGNGITRAYGSNFGLSWEDILEKLSEQFSVPINDMNKKPLPLVFEKIRLQLIRDGANPNTLLKDVSKLLDKSSLGSQLTDIYSGLARNILTTNYNRSVDGGVGYNYPFKQKFEKVDEKYHSLFRVVTDGRKNFWKIHGDTAKPNSILLGYNQYAKYMGQVKDYLYKGIKFARVKDPVRSPLMGNKPNFNFEKNTELYSWVDVFLKDQINIVGLGLDFSEIILWWLISEKSSLQAKYPSNIGDIVYYSIELPNKIKSVSEQCVLTMLSDMGARIVKVKAEDYADGYLQIAEIIRPNIVSSYNNDNFAFLRKSPD